MSLNNEIKVTNWKKPWPTTLVITAIYLFTLCISQNSFAGDPESKIKKIMKQRARKAKFQSDSKSKINQLNRTIASTLEDKKVINLKLSEIIIRVPKQ